MKPQRLCAILLLVLLTNNFLSASAAAEPAAQEQDLSLSGELLRHDFRPIDENPHVNMGNTHKHNPTKSNSRPATPAVAQLRSDAEESNSRAESPNPWPLIRKGNKAPHSAPHSAAGSARDKDDQSKQQAGQHHKKFEKIAASPKGHHTASSKNAHNFAAAAAAVSLKPAGYTSPTPKFESPKVAGNGSAAAACAAQKPKKTIVRKTFEPSVDCWIQEWSDGSTSHAIAEGDLSPESPRKSIQPNKVKENKLSRAEVEAEFLRLASIPKEQVVDVAASAAAASPTPDDCDDSLDCIAAQA